VAIGLLVFDWPFWRAPSPSPRPTVQPQPLVSNA
jgi:hypothetical protein